MIEAYRLTERKAQSLPLYLRTIGIDYHQESVRRPEGLDMAQWFYCTQGEGELILNGQRSIVRPGDAFFLASGVPHSYKELSPEWILQFFGFSGGAVPKILACLGMTESGVYRIADPEGLHRNIAALAFRLHKDGRSERFGFSEDIYHILLELSAGLSYGLPAESAAQGGMVDDIVLYMDRHYGDVISLDDLAQREGKTPEHLCAVFKEETGQTIIEFLTNLRVARARVLLLRYPEKTAGEIGRMCGFQSPAYFGKVFRKIMGMTPGQYRSGNT